MTPNKLNITPEILLPRLIKRLLELKGAISWLDEDSAKLNDALVDVLRKLIITQMLHNRYVIAVGGLQGAGKTTLLRQLYDLDSTWLESDEGRGEHFPVLVIEDSTLSSSQGYLLDILAKHTVDGEFRPDDARVATPEEFRAALKGDMKTHIMMPILKVPQQYFNGADKGFILLPGYEAVDEKNKAWQLLMRETLMSSAMCVIVTNDTKLAADQKNIRQDMNRYFEGANPVIVISKTEYNTPERNSELIQTAADIFGIAEQDISSRIICSGNTQKGRENWLPAFKLSLEKHAAITDKVRGQQVDNLGHVLNNELSRLMRDINDSLRKKSIDSSVHDMEVKNILDIFDEANKSLKKDYRRGLDSALNTHTDEASKVVERYIESDVEGFEAFLKQLGNSLKMRKGRNEREFTDAIKLAWNGNSAEGFTGRYQDVLGQVTSKKLKFRSPPMSTVIKEPRLKLGYYDENKVEIAPMALSDSIQHNLSVIFYPGRDDNHKLEHITKDLHAAIKLIPALGLEYNRIAALYPDTVGIDAQSLMPTDGGMRDTLGRIGSDFDFLKGQHSKIIKGIATILAVDFAADGKIDTIPALFHAITGTTASTAASTAATIVGGAVAIGMISICVINEVNRQNAEKHDLAIRIINAIRDNYREHYLNYYDQLMDELRNVLNDCLIIRYKLDESFMHRDRLNKALADVHSLRYDLLGEIGELAPALV